MFKNWKQKMDSFSEEEVETTLDACKEKWESNFKKWIDHNDDVVNKYLAL